MIAYDDDDDVIAMANDTAYGLAAYVYTNSLSTAMRYFEALRFGIVGINDINPTAARCTLRRELKTAEWAAKVDAKVLMST